MGCGAAATGLRSSFVFITIASQHNLFWSFFFVSQIFNYYPITPPPPPTGVILGASEWDNGTRGTWHFLPGIGTGVFWVGGGGDCVYLTLQRIDLGFH